MSTGKTILSVCMDASSVSETFVRREAEGLRRLGWKVAEFSVEKRGQTPFFCGDKSLTSSKNGAPFFTGANFACFWGQIAHLPFRQKLAVARRVRRVLELANQSPRPSLFLAQFAWITADICAIASRMSGIPWACRVHAWDVFAQPLDLLRHRLSSASAILPCTQAAADRLVEAGLSPSKIHLVRHGVDLPGTDPAEIVCPLKHETGTDSEIAVLGVGRLEPKKGFDTLVEAFQIMGTDPVFSGTGPAGIVCPFKREMGTDPGFLESVPVLRILGDGSQRAELERVAKKAKWGQTLFFGVCPHSRVREEMARATMLVLPSRRLESGDRDGVANVLLEAMAAGVPVVTTNAGCAGEVIVDGVNGLLVPPDDPQALAAAMSRLARDAGLRASLAAAARETIRTRFCDAETICRLSSVLEPMANH